MDWMNWPRGLLAGAAGALASTAGWIPGRAGAQPHSTAIRGADISSTLQVEATGRRVFVRDEAVPVERLLSNAGANYVRLRIWVDPHGGGSDAASALILARRAKSVGLDVLLDLHYSNSWADPQNQTIPAAWLGQDLPTLIETVHSYTRGIIGDFARQGTPVDMVQVGNEVTWGILWPTGAVHGDHGEHWDAFAALLNAGIAGVRDASPAGHHTAVMLHTDRGGDPEGAQHFYSAVIAAGVDDFDVIGLSYYPFWHGPLATLQTTLHELADRFEDKDLVIAETAYPWMGDHQTEVLHPVDPTALPDGSTFPATKSGQAGYFAALREVLDDVPNGRGRGFLVWEPGWLPGISAESGSSPTNLNLAMFDAQGRALPSVEAAFGPNGVGEQQS
jgi:arabinogalactan endo-1,4-beta-galactosidase